MNVPLWAWLAVLGIIAVMLAVDLFAHRKDHVIGVREALGWSAFWVALGVGFGAIIWWAYGGDFAAQYYAGYVIEKSLAVDNVFVWAIIFSYFAVPPQYQHRVLFYGVLGALVLRGAFIAAGSVLVTQFSFILYFFGAFLIFTGVQMFRQRNQHYDVSKSRALKWFQRTVPHTDEYHGSRFIVRQAGRWVATPLLAVLILVEITDVIFAVDSIPAIFAVTQEPFLVFTSNAFAILGLRAMYFLLADLIHRFTYLKAGLALVLIWVGVKMMLLMFGVKVPTVWSLALVIVIVGASIWLSLRATRGSGQGPDGGSSGGAPHAGDSVAAATDFEDPAASGGHAASAGHAAPAGTAGGAGSETTMRPAGGVGQQEKDVRRPDRTASASLSPMESPG